ncbi:MAG: tetratricopeptide repeat protein [Motiliproteus sp.]
MDRNPKPQTLKLKHNDQQAVALVQARDLEPARVLCSKLLRKYPQLADALYLLGVISFQQMKLDDAAELMSKAVRIAPANLHYACELARVEKKRGRPESAAAAIGAAV